MRDSHGLFDYESRNITKKNVRTGVSGRIVRIDDEIEFLTEDIDSTVEEGVTQILKIERQDKSKKKFHHYCRQYLPNLMCQFIVSPDFRSSHV